MKPPSVSWCVHISKAAVVIFEICPYILPKGGAIFLESVALAILETNQFSNNGAITSGGALYCFDTPHMVLDINTLDSNDASYGGGIYVSQGDFATVWGNALLDNHGTFGNSCNNSTPVISIDFIFV